MYIVFTAKIYISIAISMMMKSQTKIYETKL